MSLKITVGITAYREGDWLRECWNSVLKQTYNSWNVVLILDGGADQKTTEIFNSIVHPNLQKKKYLENKGPYPLRHEAIQIANEGWYVHLDADDLLPPQALEKIAGHIQANPHISFLYGNCLYFGNGPDSINRNEDFYPDHLCQGPTITGTSPIKVDLYRQVGGFNPKLYRGGADWDFWIGVAETGAKGMYLDEIIYQRRRVQKTNVGSKWRFHRDEVAKKIIQNRQKYFNNQDRQKKCMGYVYELMAKDYRNLFNYQQAGKYAELSKETGFYTPVVDVMISEKDFPLWKVWRRRVGFFIKNIFQ